MYSLLLSLRVRLQEQFLSGPRSQTGPSHLQVLTSEHSYKDN